MMIFQHGRADPEVDPVVLRGVHSADGGSPAAHGGGRGPGGGDGRRADRRVRPPARPAAATRWTFHTDGQPARRRCRAESEVGTRHYTATKVKVFEICEENLFTFHKKS